MKRIFVLAVALVMVLSSMGLAANNEAEVLQVGTDNEADVDQGASWQYAEVLQFGYGNTADVSQQDSDGNTGLVFQSGGLNEATIRQSWTGSGLAGGNLAEQFQLGWYNEGLIIQRGNSAADNIALQFQMGTGNFARTEQVARAHEAYIYQFGTGNDSRIRQHHNSAYAESYQFGDDNSVEIQQWTTTGQEAYAYQFGDSNSSDIFQRVPNDGTALQGNLATTLQVGDNNDSLVTQATNFNTASVMQFGSGNSSTVAQ